jgi:hypothetical protein
MDPIEFVKTIYLGDRAVKAVLVYTWAKIVKLQIDRVSRIRGDDWNYYSDEDIVDGNIVFEVVDQFSIEPPGFLPNDEVHDIQVARVAGESGKFQVSVFVGSVDDAGTHGEVNIRLRCENIALENPLNPGAMIRG